MSAASRPKLTAFAQRVPSPLLTGHVILGTLQILLGFGVICMATYAFITWSTADVILDVVPMFVAVSSGPVFIIVGAVGLAGGVGRSNTRCCLISCIVLCVLTICANIVSMTLCVLAMRTRISPVGVLWVTMFVAEMLVVLFQLVLACLAVCCCPAPEFAQEDHHRMRTVETAPVGYSAGSNVTVSTSAL